MESRLEYLISFQKYLIYFLPISLVTGSFLPDLSVSIIAIIFLVIVLFKKKWKYLINYFSIFFLFGAHI